MAVFIPLRVLVTSHLAPQTSGPQAHAGRGLAPLPHGSQREQGEEASENNERVKGHVEGSSTGYAGSLHWSSRPTGEAPRLKVDKSTKGNWGSILGVCSCVGITGIVSANESLCALANGNS